MVEIVHTKCLKSRLKFLMTHFNDTKMDNTGNRTLALQLLCFTWSDCFRSANVHNSRNFMGDAIMSVACNIPELRCARSKKTLRRRITIVVYYILTLKVLNF